MDKTEKLLAEFYAARELEKKDSLDESDIKKQVRVLETPGGYNTRKAIDYLQRSLVPHPVTPTGVQRKFPHEWTPEYDASVRLLNHGSMIEAAETRRFCRIIENCRDFRDVLAHEADFRGAEQYAQRIIFWLRVKYGNLKLLYENYPRERKEYFDSDAFALLVFGLCYGFYNGYRVEGSKLIRPKDEVLNPETAMSDFPKVDTEPVTGMWTKGSNERSRYG